MPKKIRVYELAHELGLTNKEALDLCLSLGMGVKSHSSSIEDAQADRARRKADREGLRRPVQPEEPAAPAKKAAAKKAPAKTAAPSTEPATPAAVDDGPADEGAAPVAPRPGQAHRRPTGHQPSRLGAAERHPPPAPRPAPVAPAAAPTPRPPRSPRPAAGRGPPHLPPPLPHLPLGSPPAAPVPAARPRRSGRGRSGGRSCAGRSCAGRSGRSGHAWIGARTTPHQCVGPRHPAAPGWTSPFCHRQADPPTPGAGGRRTPPGAPASRRLHRPSRRSRRRPSRRAPHRRPPGCHGRWLRRPSRWIHRGLRRRSAWRRPRRRPGRPRRSRWTRRPRRGSWPSQPAPPAPASSESRGAGADHPHRLCAVDGAGAGHRGHHRARLDGP